MSILSEAHQNPGSRRYRPAHRAYRHGTGSADRFGQQVRAKLVAGSLPRQRFVAGIMRTSSKKKNLLPRVRGLTNVKNTRTLKATSDRTTYDDRRHQEQQQNAARSPCGSSPQGWV